MKKYIVKFKGSEKVFGEYASKEEASKRLIEYFNDYNDDICVDFASPFDFTLEVVECKDVNEVITDFDSARELLGIRSNFDITVSKKRFSKSVVPIKGVARIVNELNPKHIEALVALNRLFTIAEAWNKLDGFVPDFSDFDKEKWFPWFNYDNDTERFVYTATNLAPANVGAPFGSRICFKTSERAKQFGKQFEELYNQVFL